MSGAISVRPARDSEIETARDLTNRSWVMTYGPLIGKQATHAIIADRHSPARFAEQAAKAAQADAKSKFLVAYASGNIVGHCYAYEEDGCYVDRLHVDPEKKGSGIGRAMLNYVVDKLQPGDRIWLQVLRGNDPAIAFYRRVGFQQVAETDACGGLAGIPAVILEKAAHQENV